MMQLSTIEEIAGALAQSPDPDPQPTQTAPAVPSTLAIVGSIALIGGLLVISGIYNQWAYDDWTCMLKNCVQTSSKRRR